jgi:Phorbol esters/diacylglycerol binding domain (C1 domain)
VDLPEHLNMSAQSAEESHWFFGQHFNRPTYCTECEGLLWGVTGKQGVQCEQCACIAHRKCVHSFSTPCLTKYLTTARVCVCCVSLCFCCLWACVFSRPVCASQRTV